ncbi:hypothetical protein V8E54_009300 [Elaphomyces granulatus]
MASQSRPDTVEPTRSRSNTCVSKGSRPRSRGSTTSIISNTTQQTQDQHLADGLPPFVQSRPEQSLGVLNPSPEEMLMRFQLSQPSNTPAVDPSLQETHHNLVPQANGFQGHSIPHHELPHTSLPSELPPRELSVVPVSHYNPAYDSSMDAHIPERVMEENEHSEAGFRKRRGTSSTIANDNELRKLLRQYDGYTLKQMAVEVQKHEGAGGKSEKVKQVFAMIWLKENCVKSAGSVRRDRVYCCYAEKCGTERVSVLNPASFGKLVRIIFPNVQTRRLGVRGESKYHYVDLSVIEEKQLPSAPNPFEPPDMSGTTGNGDNRFINTVLRTRSVSNSQPPVDTAVFPSPTICFAPKFPIAAPGPGCSCEPLSPSNLDSVVTVENLSSYSGRLIRQMLEFPSSEPLMDRESLRLPDIRAYLPANTDLKIADALAALYRTHCISVIDSFRYCRERNLFRHFSAFHGTLTVPVQKLLTHPNLGPWIKDCDWLMYQKMVEFVAPLTTQVVPKQVLDAFGSISQRLTLHISETSKSQPVHMSLARLLPAHVFCNLLKHMLDVNQSAIAASAWLRHPDNRNQMWLDFTTYVDPKEMMSRANIPSCAEQATEQILKHDIRDLLTPLEDPSARLFARQSDSEADRNAHKFPVHSSVGDEYNFPDKWIAFILTLPAIFPHHRAQCIVDKVDALWNCILHRLTLAGAQSFSAWWMTKVFFHEMMLWLVEKGVFMKQTPSALQTASALCEVTAFNGPLARSSRSPGLSMSVKVQSPIAPDIHMSDSNPVTTNDAPSGGATQEGSPALDPSQSNAPLGNEEPMANAEDIPSLPAPNNDDSAIDLDDESMVGKYGDMMASDTADANGDVVVI